MSELKPRHTSKPWKHDVNSRPDSPLVRGADGTPIASLGVINMFERREEGLANIEEIERCVNAHEGLVEALEKIRNFSHGGAISMSVDAHEFHEIELMAVAALAQAKGGE